MSIFNYISEEEDIIKLKKTVLDWIMASIEDKNIIMKNYNLLTDERNLLKTQLQELINLYLPHFYAYDFEKFESPKVSIIIPVKNGYSYTRVLLNAIKPCTKGIEYEIIIADDNSDDETVNIENDYKNIKRVVNKTGKSGFLFNVQNAVKEAKGEYIFLLNNNTIVLDGYLKELLNVLEGHSEIGIAGSNNLYPDGKILDCGVNYLNDGALEFIGTNQEHNKLDDKEYIECDYCIGSSILFKKEVWEKAGGFDENYAPAYYEDIDFAFNVRNNLKLKCVSVPKSKIFHFRGRTYATSDAEKNKKYFLKKWEDKLNNKK